MKTKEFYERKIKESEIAIKKYKLAIKNLEIPKPLKQKNGKSTVISIRVPKEKADAIKAEWLKDLDSQVQVIAAKYRKGKSINEFIDKTVGKPGSFKRIEFEKTL